MPILIYLFLIHLNAWIDYQQIKRKKSPNHAAESAAYVLASACIAYAFTGFTMQTIFLVLHALTIRWLLFDMLLNGYRGLPIDYIGKTSFIDKQLNKLPNPNATQYILKYGLALIIILLNILFYV